MEPGGLVFLDYNTPTQGQVHGLSQGQSLSVTSTDESHSGSNVETAVVVSYSLLLPSSFVMFVSFFLLLLIDIGE